MLYDRVRDGDDRVVVGEKEKEKKGGKGGLYANVLARERAVVVIVVIVVVVAPGSCAPTHTVPPDPKESGKDEEELFTT